jgi:TRAP-type C4-dicarboxylate transport system permease small subunit
MGVRRLAARIRSLLFAALCAVAACIMIAMTGLEIVQVFLRYVAGSGFIWTGDISVLLMQSLAWIGAPALWLCRGHIAVELIGLSRDDGARDHKAIILDILIVVAALALLHYGQDALAAFANIDVPSLGTSGSIKYYPMMTGAVLLLSSGLLNLVAGPLDLPTAGAES